MMIPGTLAKIAAYMSLYFPRLTEKLVDWKITSTFKKQKNIIFKAGFTNDPIEEKLNLIQY